MYMAKKKIETGIETPPENLVVKKAKPAAKNTTAKKPAAITATEKKTAPAKEKKAAAAKSAAIADVLKNVEVYSRFTDFDIALFKSGKHYKLYEKLGSHVIDHKNVTGTYFAVWAPNAHYVAVI